MEYLIIVIANILIGGMIGLTGIAGFLLPMLYSGFLGMSTMQGLALSFFAFLISGVLGAYNYYRAQERAGGGERKRPDRTEDSSCVLADLWSGDRPDLCPFRGRGTDPCHAASCCVESSGQNSGRHCAV